MSEQTIVAKNATTFHIKTPISRDDLDAVIIGLEVACGGVAIVVTEAFDLVVKDERQVKALRALFGENGNKPEDVIPKHKRHVSADPERKRGNRYSYIIEATGERISKQALAIRLDDHNIELGTRLSHPTKGKFVVTCKSDDDPSLVLVEAGKWEASHE